MSARDSESGAAPRGRSRRPRLLAPLFALALAACAPYRTVDHPPDAPPAFHDGAPYAGRVVLEAPGLSGDARATWPVIERRLSLLRLQALSTLDSDRIHLDVYGPLDAAALTLAAERLASPIAPAVRVRGRAHSLDDARIALVLGPREGCECKGIVEMSWPRIEALAPEPGVLGERAWVPVSRLRGAPLLDGGRELGLTLGRVDVEWERSPSESGRGTWRVRRTRVALTPPGDDVFPHVWALGAGRFPGPVRVAEVRPARASVDGAAR